MDGVINVCVVGAGRISNLRHIPALRKLKRIKIIGVLGDNPHDVNQTAKKWRIPHSEIITESKTDFQKLKDTEWFEEVDAMIIGVPPKQHYPVVRLALNLHKHVLVEKPMMMNKKECDELIELAKQVDRQFAVVHNFQFTPQMQKLTKIVESKKFGKIVSITEVQFTNRDRNLPKWYNSLPLGLFFDESAHFLYLPRIHCGELNVKNGYSTHNTKREETPLMLNVEVLAGNIPVHMMMNFNSPICEWYYIVCFKKVIYIYDFFKDILVSLPTDSKHLSKDVLKNSLLFSIQYWTQFIKNGFKMITGNLLYGNDVVMKKFIEGIRTKKYDESISAESGKAIVIAMNQIVEKVRLHKST